MARRILTALWTAALLIGFAAPPAQAQTEITIDQLLIRIWPEFDRPAALVFWSGVMDADTVLPVALTFTLPEGATINAVAYEENGSLYNAGFDVQGGELAMVSPNGTFHIELYDPAIQVEGTQREYIAVWQSGYAVRELVWEVQQPPDVRALQVSPGTATLGTDQLGLTSFRVAADPVEAGERVTLTVQYPREGAALTVDLLAAQENPLPVIEDPAPAEALPAWAWAVIALNLVVIGALVVAIVRGQIRDARQDAEDAAVQPVSPLEAGSAPPGEPAPADILTEREIEVLLLLVEGLTNREIGERLGISHKTAARHRENMMNKLDLHSRTDLIKYAIRHGVVALS